MRQRLRAAVVIGRRQLMEALLDPGPWIALVAGLLLGHLVVASFLAAVDSSGFEPTLSPFLGLVARAASSAFGEAFAAVLFAEGPLLLAVLAATAPVLGWLAISSVFRFGLEKADGAMELLAVGPVDGAAICLASVLRDAVLAAGAIVAVFLFLLVEAVVGNLALGPTFLVALPALLLAAVAVSTLGILCSTLTGNAASGLGLFGGIAMVFLLDLAGSAVVSTSALRSAASVVSLVVQWFSPFAWLARALGAISGAANSPLLPALVLQVALAGALLGVSFAVIGRRGVRG